MVAENKRVFVVSSDPHWVRKLSELCQAIGFTVQVFETFAEYLVAVKQKNVQGCIVVDWRMDGRTCLGLRQEMTEANVALPVLIAVAEANFQLAHQEAREQAFGCISVSASPSQIRSSIDVAHASQKKLRSHIDIHRSHLKLTKLTPRQRSIVDRATDGDINVKIAKELGVGVKTIERDRREAYRVLEVRSVAEMARVVTLADMHDIV